MSASPFATEMAALAESFADKIDKFYQLRTAYAELLSQTDINLKPIENILYQRDILLKFNDIAGQIPSQWKLDDILLVQKNYNVFLMYLRVRNTKKQATPYELDLYKAFTGIMGLYFSKLLREMVEFVQKRDAQRPPQ